MMTRFNYGDLIYIANEIATSNVPFIVESTKDFNVFIDKENKSDRRINYIDSSIWLRYAYNKETEDAIKAEFQTYYELGLYNTSRAKENREFNSRLLRNSYLKNIDDAGHGNDVVPFVFHSETDMKNKYTEILNKLKEFDINNKIEWRVLIVDDHATERTARDACNNGKEVVAKCKIIQQWFADLGFNFCCISCQDMKGTENCPKLSLCNRKNEESTLKVSLECAETIDDAHMALQTKKYDLILLDYLIKENNKPRYIDELLEKIKVVFDEEINNNEEKKEWLLAPIKKSGGRGGKVVELANKSDKDINKLISQKKGSGGKFKFLFMSAFVNAVNNHMLQLGLLPNTSYWHFGRGACPTTTPNFFKYYLVRTMYDQVCEITRLHNISEEKRIVTLINLLSVIYDKQSECRQNAIKYFNALLKMRLNYDIFKYDVCIDNYSTNGKMKEGNQSLFVESLFPDVGYYNNAFWEHVMHLVYLTAFGTIRQWRDMWDEYVLVKDTLKKADEECRKKFGDGDRVVQKIEKYICSLQEK